MKVLKVLGLPAIVVRHRELLGSFIWRDLKARYEGSLLGRLWPILNPLITFALFYFVFALIMKQRLDARGLPADLAEKIAALGPGHMGLYILAGVLPWGAFSEAVTRCTGVVLENGNLVKKIAFPSELLPIYAVAVSAVYFLIGLTVFLVVLGVFFGGLPPMVWLLLLAIPLQLVLTAGVGLFLGAFNIFVRDTSQLIGQVLQLVFFTTPIVYLAVLIEDQLQERAWLVKLNPIYHLMELYHCALVPYYPDVFYAGQPPWASVAVVLVVSCVALMLGYAFFLATKGRFADEL